VVDYVRNHWTGLSEYAGFGKKEEKDKYFPSKRFKPEAKVGLITRIKIGHGYKSSISQINFVMDLKI
jgi:hypothetical protein